MLHFYWLGTFLLKNPLKHVELLDYLRGIAILAVLLCHTFAIVYGYDRIPWNGWVRNFSVSPFAFLCAFPISLGQAGVAMFFVVSGFCIHMSFQKQGQRWGSFFIRRIFRIYPAYLAALIFSILLVSLKPFPLMFQEQDLWKQFYTHLFLIHNYLPSTIKDFNPPFWSLAIEAQLYLIYPVLLILVARLGWRRTLVILAGCEVLIQGTDGLMQAIGAANNIGGKISWVLANSPLGYWFSWSLGAFIADAFLNNKPLPFLKASPLGWLVLAAVGCYVKPLDSFQFLSFAIATAVITSQFLSGARPKIEVHAFSLNILRNIGL
jgi:peptidoglycan/LPS O-acetylase OafA/YrhL